MDSVLRDVTDADLPVFFAHQLDKEAIHMAAFTTRDPTDRTAFMARWDRMMTTSSIRIQTIVFHGQVAGHVMSYEDDGRPEVTYWLGREFWGQGLATRALSEFLARGDQTRPIYARAAKDNASSIRVLQKCGFGIVGEGKGFAHGRQAEIEEWVLSLAEPYRCR